MSYYCRSMIEDLTKSQILFDIFKQSCKQALDQELYDQNNAGHQVKLICAGDQSVIVIDSIFIEFCSYGTINCG